MRKQFGLLTAVVLISGCGEVDLPDVDPNLVTPESVAAHFSALPEAPVMPDAAMVALGKQLFWDPVLSGNQDIACASCHHPDFDYGDGLFASIGVGGTGLGPARSGPVRVRRNAPTLINVAFNGIDIHGSFDPAVAPMMWDLRLTSLEGQALDPVRSGDEMRGQLIREGEVDAVILARLDANPAYRQSFQSVFGLPQNGELTMQQIALALAAFQRTLVATNSPFDQFMRGDRTAMTERQIVGMQNFIDAGCAGCHNGPMFSDFQTHVLSAPDHPSLASDPDRGADDAFAFRTPTMRNLANTGPYMHGGSLGSLSAVLDFYEDLEEDGSQNRNVSGSQLDPLVNDVRGVEDGKSAIIDFLGALNDAGVDREVPAAVPSGLPPGGLIGPR